MNIDAIIKGIKAGLKNLLKGKVTEPSSIDIDKKESKPEIPTEPKKDVPKKNPIAKAKLKKETTKKQPAKTGSKKKTKET